MDNLFYDLAIQMSYMTKCLKSGDEYGARNASLIAKNVVLKISDSKPYSKFQANLVFVEVFNYLSLDTTLYEAGHRKCLSMLKDIYGEQHVVLSDIYYFVSSLRSKQGNFPEAVEYAGRGLLIRIKKLGVMHEKTADSHFSLGTLYAQIGEHEKARKELYISRGIRSQVFAENSLHVATCDMAIGHVELQCNEQMKAYFAFYKAYHTRYLALGGTHALTMEAEELMVLHRTMNGERFITSRELKDRVLELAWEQEETYTLQYSISMFVNRLSWDEVLITPQVKGLVSNAVQFSLSRLIATASPHSNNSNMSHDTPLSSSGSLISASGETKAQVNALTLLLLMPCRPIAPPDPVTMGTSSSGLNSRPHLLSASSSSGDINAAADAKLPSTPQSLSRMRSQSQDNAPVSENKANSTTATYSDNNNIDNSNSITAPNSASKFGAKMLSFTFDINDANHSSNLTSNNTSNAYDSPKKSHAAPRFNYHTNPRNSVLNRSHSDSSVPTNRISSAGNGGTGFSSISTDLAVDTDGKFSYRPKNIKPVSPNLYRSRLVAPTTAMKCGDLILPLSIGKQPYVFARDQDGVLVLVKRATGEEMVSVLNTKLLSIGLFPWLATNNIRDRGKPEAAPVAEGKRGSVVNKRSSVAASSITRGSVVALSPEDKNAGKANLLALFAKKGPQGGGDAAGSTKGKGPTVGPDWAAVIPIPPPVPTSWPPVPYTGKPGNASGENSEAPSGTNSPVPDGTGGVGGSDNPGYDPTKPKLKQVYLVGLPSIANTLWETNDVDVDPGLLFDDLEAEFVIGAPKAKPKPFAMGGAPTPGGKTPGKAVKSAAESILDPQRAQNINIMLAKFGKRSMFEIAKAVENFDADALGLPAVTSLLTFVPSPDEVAKINAYAKTTLAALAAAPKKAPVTLFATASENEGDEPVEQQSEDAKVAEAKTAGPKTDAEILTELKLGKAEQYIYIMSKVPQLETKLVALTTALTAAETCANIEKSSHCILKAVDEVKGSVKFKFLLRSFLELGNTLSKHSKLSAGPLSGIKLSSLSELSRTKSNSGDTADLYVVSKLLAHFPEVLEVTSDMPSLDEARGVIFNRMVPELKKVEEGLALMTQLRDANSSAAVASSDKPSHLERYLAATQKMFSAAAKDLKDSQSDFQDLCAYFGEESSDPEGLFGLIITFLRGIQAASGIAQAKAKRKARLLKPT